MNVRSASESGLATYGQICTKITVAISQSDYIWSRDYNIVTKFIVFKITVLESTHKHVYIIPKTYDASCTCHAIIQREDCEIIAAV